MSTGTHDGVEMVDITMQSQDPFTLGVAAAPPMPPDQRIYFYSPDEWERFIVEWANALDENYFQVKRHAGSGDLGLDVIGLLTDQGIDGDWDCFQCKHYEKPLAPGDAYAEMYKIIRGVVHQEFSLPRNYKFLAPKGCGQTLNRLLSSPAKLRQEFLKWLQGKASPLHKEANAGQARILSAANSFNYNIFKSEEIEDVLKVHRRSPYHALRFDGVSIRRSSTLAVVPQDVDRQRESVYIKKLVEVYNERHGAEWLGVEDITEKASRDHFNRQREAFFSAEDLRLTARDQVPPAVFTALQDEVFDGVVEVEQMDHPTGLQRLNEVTMAAARLQLTSNPLISITKQKDRTGLCHQLANDDRLNWIPKD